MFPSFGHALVLANEMGLPCAVMWHFLPLSLSFLLLHLLHSHLLEMDSPVKKKKTVQVDAVMRAVLFTLHKAQLMRVFFSAEYYGINLHILSNTSDLCHRLSLLRIISHSTNRTPSMHNIQSLCAHDRLHFDQR